MTSENAWNASRIRELVQARFAKRACYFQIEVALALYEKNDVIACAPTGAGKTLSFWIPLLMAKADGLQRMSFVITPLNVLGEQNARELSLAGIRAVAVNGKNMASSLWKEIEDEHYEVVIISPELIVGCGELRRLWQNRKFTSKILNIIIDEGHCVSEWGRFRKEYKRLGALRTLITGHIPFYVASATLPKTLLTEIKTILGIRPEKTKEFLYSNDRPEIALCVQTMNHPVGSYNDLNFLIPSGGDAEPLKKFLVFFDSIKEAESAAKHLQKKLDEKDSSNAKIIYFTATMTDHYRRTQLEAFREGEVHGVMATDAFGMGVHLTGLSLVVQYRATCTLNSLFQRFGRAARGADETATAILLVEKKDTDEFRLAKRKRAEAKAIAAASRANRKRKAADTATNASGHRPQKRARGETTVEVPEQFLAGQAEVVVEMSEGREGELVETLRGNDGDGSGNVDNGSGDGGESGGNDGDGIAGDRNDMGLDNGDGLMDVEARSQRYDTVGSKPTANHGGQSAQSKSKQVEIDSPMDDFINARIRGARCLRVVPSAYFGNNKRATSNHLQCDLSSAEGCQRCKPRPTHLCCLICSPNAFSQYFVPTSKSTAAPKKSSVKLSPKADRSKMDALLNALFAWRTAQAKVEFGPKLVRMYGTMLFVPDEVLHRTVLCAQAGKLISVESLRREIGWAMNWAEKYLESLLDVVFQFYPLTAPQSTPTAPSNAPARRPASSLPAKEGSLTSRNPNMPQGPPEPKRPIRCSACRQTGHNRRPIPSFPDIFCSLVDFLR